MLPCTIACTAIGIAGVGVKPRVAVMAGDGVMTKNVGVFCGRAAGFVGRLVAGARVDVGRLPLVVALGAGALGFPAGRLTSSRTTATTTESRPPTSDHRARATYLCRMR